MVLARVLWLTTLAAIGIAAGVVGEVGAAATVLTIILAIEVTIALDLLVVMSGLMEKSTTYKSGELVVLTTSLISGSGCAMTIITETLIIWAALIRCIITMLTTYLGLWSVGLDITMITWGLLDTFKTSATVLELPLVFLVLVTSVRLWE